MSLFTSFMRHAASGTDIVSLIQKVLLQPASVRAAVQSPGRFYSGAISPPTRLPSLDPFTSLPLPCHPVFSTTLLPSFLQPRHFSISSTSLAQAPLRVSHPPPSGTPFGTPWGGLRTFAAVPRRADGHVDIAAKARASQVRKLWQLVGGGAVVAAFAAFVLNAFQENLVFYITPTQAMATLSEEGVAPDSKRRLRLGGLVLDHSVRHFRNSTEMEFVVTDLATELLVRYRGALPDLFREGHSVVVEGFLRPGVADEPGEAITGQLKPADPSIAKQTGLGMEGQTAGGERAKGCFFAATEVLAKHDEKYMPKEVAAVVAANKAAIDAEKGLIPALARTEERPKKPSKQTMGQQPLQVQQYEMRS